MQLQPGSRKRDDDTTFDSAVSTILGFSEDHKIVFRDANKHFVCYVINDGLFIKTLRFAHEYASSVICNRFNNSLLIYSR